MGTAGLILGSSTSGMEPSPVMLAPVRVRNKFEGILDHCTMQICARPLTFLGFNCSLQFSPQAEMANAEHTVDFVVTEPFLCGLVILKP